MASWLSFGDAESFFKIVEGTTARVLIDAPDEAVDLQLAQEGNPFGQPDQV
ncbi:hypothetical protein [Mesorhizobium sp.]|uniref:hypothetical protein n=1 Tax=Mesorhizobium sp. TaxID=1871066 RepID=UPI002579F4AB|nr:hypothetical protein [Mesorhizobium sp.]